jgi:alkylated DNA repair dioxygenase AlkB
MSQMPLFSSASETVLVDDELGRIAYTPGFLPAEVARAWFAELRESVPWKTQRRRMYDREVDVPRLLAHFRLAPEESCAPDAIRVAARKVIAVTGVPFNSVGLNFYRDGRDSVAPHNDHLDEIVHGFPIALLSLGATRRMTIRATEPPRRVLQNRSHQRQPADHELRDAAALYARDPQDQGAGRRAHQPGLSRKAGV